MTYVAAVRCKDGIVISADTQETYGEDICYVEKIAIEKTPTFDLVIGGAGRSELIDGFIEYAANRVRKQEPKTCDELRGCLSAALLRFYSRDVKIFPGKNNKEIAFLIAARRTNPPNDIALWRTAGTRLKDVPKYATIGYGKTLSNNVARRLYRDDLPPGQAVLLSVYLVAVAKSATNAVGDDTQVVFVRDNGVWPEETEYVSILEARAKESLSVVDDLFLTCSDVGLNKPQFDERIAALIVKAQQIRKKHLTLTANRLLEKILRNEWPNDPYPKSPLGGSVQLKQNASGQMYCEIDDSPFRPPKWMQLGFGREAWVKCKNQQCQKDFGVPSSQALDAFQSYNKVSFFDRAPLEEQQEILKQSGCGTIDEYEIKAKAQIPQIGLVCPFCIQRNDYGYDDIEVRDANRVILNI